MWPYILLIMLPIVVQYMRLDGTTLYVAKPGDNNKGAMVLFWGLLLTLLMLRHETVGVDIKNYKYIFNYCASNSWSVSLDRSAEIAYSILNKVVSLCTNNFRWIIVITSILSVCFIAKSYIKYSKDAALTIALFIIMSNFVLLFSGIRQAIAISLGFVAFECVRKKRLILFVSVVVIAILFHTSAFMLIFMYPIYHARITKKWLIVVIPLLVVLFIFNEPIFGRLLVILSIFTKYDAEMALNGSYTMLILFSIFAVFSYLIPEESELDSDTIGMRNFLLFSVVIQMFAPLHNLAMRMNYYYIVFIPLLIPRIINCRSTRWRQVAIIARHVMVVFFILYFYVVVSKDNALKTFPYHFLWEQI